MMRNVKTSIVAGGLSLLMGLTSIGSAEAMPIQMPVVGAQTQSDVQQVDYSGGMHWRHHGGWHGRHGYHGGGRYGGYRHGGYYRHGYRHHNGAWVPLAAFAAGAIIAGAASRPAHGMSHTQWCASRYRSYRASDNTFQPYNGPRQQCR